MTIIICVTTLLSDHQRRSHIVSDVCFVERDERGNNSAQMKSINKKIRVPEIIYGSFKPHSFQNSKGSVCWRNFFIIIKWFKSFWSKIFFAIRNTTITIKAGKLLLNNPVKLLEIKFLTHWWYFWSRLVTLLDISSFYFLTSDTLTPFVIASCLNY